MASLGSKTLRPALGRVLLHVGRGSALYNFPIGSADTLKIETYLKMAKIPYLYAREGGRAPRKNVTWIEYNGEKVGNHYIIMKYLNKQFNVDLNRNLNKEEKVTATFLRDMTESRLALSINMDCFLWTDKERTEKMLGRSISWGIRLFGRYYVWSSGETREVIYELTEEQLSAVSAMLGDKPYLFGNEPSEVDCSMMGVLGQVKWNMEGSFHYNVIEEKFPNISRYLDRMKTTYFPDWEELKITRKSAAK